MTFSSPRQPSKQSPVTLSADVQHAHRVRELIDELLADPRQLGPDYQPIVDLASGAVVGYKATGRGKPGTELADTLSLLAQAQSLGLVERIDWAFRALAFEDFARVPDLELHLTPEPDTYGTLCPPRHAALFARAKRETRVAAEVHDDALADRSRLRRGLEEIRSWGWRVVLADVCDAPGAHDALADVAPDVVQVDLSRAGRTAGVANDAVRRWVEAAHAAGAELMALGVDSPAAKTAALELGATTARGALFGLPGALPA
jgi:EAL domain-containing protein (putative c-di-GMP-specific phosphodiesterase class I)